MNDLDDLLARSAPPSAQSGPALDAAIGALVDEARSAPPQRRRWSQRPWAIAAVALGTVGVLSGAAYGAYEVLDNEPWMNLTSEAEAMSADFEWLTTAPGGDTCVVRLTGVGLSPEQESIVAAALADPHQLLAADDGAVRAEFLGFYDDSDSQQELADRETFESWIDAGYNSVTSLDIARGRGDYADTDLTPGGKTTAERSVFFDAQLRVVLDGITAQGVDAMTYLTPQTACEASE